MMRAAQVMTRPVWPGRMTVPTRREPSGVGVSGVAFATPLVAARPDCRPPTGLVETRLTRKPVGPDGRAQSCVRAAIPGARVPAGRLPVPAILALCTLRTAWTQLDGHTFKLKPLYKTAAGEWPDDDHTALGDARAVAAVLCWMLRAAPGGLHLGNWPPLPPDDHHGLVGDGAVTPPAPMSGVIGQSTSYSVWRLAFRVRFPWVR
jgi:hypothetical protein